MNQHAKAIIAGAVPLVAASGSWITTGAINAPEIAMALTALVTAILVAIFRNDPASPILSVLKFLVAALAPVISAGIQYAATGAFDRAEFATIVVGALTSILVYLSSEGCLFKEAASRVGSPRRRW
jgi:hypothetical protein